MAIYAAAAGASSINTKWNLGFFWTQPVLSASPSELVIQDAFDFSQHYLGFGFAYDSLNHPTAGTITEIDLRFSVSGQPDSMIVTLTDVSIPAVQFFDWVKYNANETALQTIFAGDDSLKGAPGGDHLAGYGGHDVILGYAGNDTLIGGDGNDHLYGQSPGGGSDGADSISGGEGTDYIQGNAGNDTLDGGGGPDRIQGGADNDLITGGDGNDTINGNRGDDTIEGGSGSDSIRGGQDQDIIKGGDGNDVLQGDNGNDSISGDNGEDLLAGGDYGDTLIGGAGNDTLNGGHMGDILTGGDGADLFWFDRYASRVSDAETPANNLLLLGDTITDFTPGLDHLQLYFKPTAILYATMNYDVDDPIGDVMRGHTGYGEVVLVESSGVTQIFASADGNSDSVGLSIVLLGISPSAVTLSDFI
jgi:serralysin